jgi:hypothetical protein
MALPFVADGCGSYRRTHLKSWHGLPLPIDARVEPYSMLPWYSALVTAIGSSSRLCDCTRALFAVCTRRKLSVKERKLCQTQTDLRKFLRLAAIVQFVELWELMDQVHLTPDVEDAVTWRWTDDGVFTVALHMPFSWKAAREQGTTHNKLIWKSDATLRCKVFSWLAVLGRCLKADNL